MKKIFIVRHAKSSWDYPDLSDIDRPLNKRGKKNAPEMGKRLAAKGLNPDKLITSPAKRAAATAKIIARELGYPLDKIEKNDDLYHGTVEDIKNVIRSVDDNVETLMIFGHNPDLTTLTNRLSGSEIYNIPTCGVAEIEFDISAWKELEYKGGSLSSFDYPKRLVKS
jgi:phosphohistidine phosphatase